MAASLIALAVLAIPPALAQTPAPGSAVTSFGASGIASAGPGVRLFGTAVQTDGKALAVGESGLPSALDLVLVRFTANGVLDPKFGSGGVVHGPAIAGLLGTGSLGRAVAIQPDGKIVVVGTSTVPDGSATTGILIERFNSNGAVDTTFGTGGAVTALAHSLADGYAVAVQPNGQIIATGSANAAGSGGVTPRVAVVRLNANGSLDPSFGSGGASVLDFGSFSTALTVALQSDGKIVIGGSQSPGLQVQNALIARLTPSGAPDPSFGSGGAYAHQYAIGAASSTFDALAIQSNGSIVAAGSATQGNTGANAIVARFTTAGTPDGSFGGGVVAQPSASGTVIGGTIPGVTGVGLAHNGDIIAGGSVAQAGFSHIAVWAFKPTGALDTGFGTAGTVATSLGATTSGTGNALAIGPAGQVVVAGDAKAITGVYSGVETAYNGFAPPVPPPPAFKLSLKGVSGKYKIATVAKHGLKVGVACNGACTIKASLTLSASTAKRLHILTTFRKCTKKKGKQHCVKARGYRTVTLASGKATLKRAGTHTFTLRIGKGYAKALKQVKKRQSVTANLRVTATSSTTHKGKTINKHLTFTG
ncbi:MAG: hypothetical protein ACR2NR_17490 [Solirubrobacteraceae bacterium]